MPLGTRSVVAADPLVFPGASSADPARDAFGPERPRWSWFGSLTRIKDVHRESRSTSVFDEIE